MINNTIEKTLDQELEDIAIEEAMNKIKYKVMIMSNKGGVGKSMVAANLTDELANQGYQVGLLDIDIHGPSQAKIFNIENKRLMADDDHKIMPFQPRENLKLITIAGILENEDQPLIWRGPLKLGIIKQFLKDVTWSELDYLIIDAPPGTGDEPLTIAQLLPDLNGIVIVTTPQNLALLDCKKAIKFAEQLNTRIIGLIENMSILQCPHCGKEINLFRIDAKKQLTSQLGIDFLGELPFEPKLLQSMDFGNPFMHQHKETQAARNLNLIINKIKEKLT